MKGPNATITEQDLAGFLTARAGRNRLRGAFAIDQEIRSTEVDPAIKTTWGSPSSKINVFPKISDLWFRTNWNQNHRKANESAPGQFAQQISGR